MAGTKFPPIVYSAKARHVHPQDFNEATKWIESIGDNSIVVNRDIDLDSHQLANLSVPDANGEAIRQTTKITEANLEVAYDHSQVVTGNPHAIDLTDLSSYDHKDLQNLQGGQANEYYHATAAEYAELVQFLDNITVGSGGLVSFVTPIRGVTSLWWRIQHVDISSIPATGAVGAVYVPQSANNLNGYQLDNNPSEEYLYFNTHIGTDWDEASDLEFVVNFETNVDNSGGLVTDTVDFDLVMYYKGDGETTQKTQTLSASVVVGQAAQYYHSQVTFTIDYDKVDHVVQIGDCVSWQLHLNTTDSEVDNVIVHHGMFRYKTNKVRAEV